MQLPIRTTPIDRLRPAPYNPRVELKPGDHAFEALRKGIGEFGCAEFPVVNVRNFHIVSGHQRISVLRALGETKVKVVVVDLPLEKEKALSLALNRIRGEWDEDKLAALLRDLSDAPDLDLELTGFDVDEIGDLFGDPTDDRVEAFEVEASLDGAGPAVTEPGDLIELGEHRLLCGDSTDPAQVRQLMGGERATLFATDPPYCVGYDGTNHPGKSRRKGRARGGRGRPKDWSGTYGKTWDDAEANPDLYRDFIQAAVGEAIELNAAWYCWHASSRQAMVEEIWNEAGAFVHCQIIWVKNRGVPTRTWYLWGHEPCLMGWLRGHRPPRRTRERLSTVWEVPTLGNGSDRPDHPTPKPLELFEIPMRQHTRPGEVCYEPFAGSGTQFIAAERLGRRCFGIEISPVYADLIVRRYIAWRGEGAVARKIANRYRLQSKTVRRGVSS